MTPEKLRTFRALASDCDLLAKEGKDPRTNTTTGNPWVHRKFLSALGVALREACDELDRLELELANARAQIAVLDRR